MRKNTHFERAVFLSWYCARGDCKFCYMSTQKDLIKDPKKARRSFESILAEVIICKKFGWRIEFLSGGYESFSKDEILFLLKTINDIYKEKVWLNIGVLNKKELELYKPYIKGFCGAVECINKKVHDDVCPSKSIEEIIEMFKVCGELGLKKAMTIILGLGETVKDIGDLNNFIKKHKIDKITFYRLKPQKNTAFENTKPITTDYYIKWVKGVRKENRKIKITVGSWITHLTEISLLLNAGADAVTKFPSIKLFNTRYARTIEKEAQRAERKFLGTLTKMPKVKFNEVDMLKIPVTLKERIKDKLRQYLNKMRKS